MTEDTACVEFRHVTKIYNKSQLPAVSDINLKIARGAFCCLIGTSGSGKTTLMRMINRMNPITKGTVLVNGQDVKNLNPVNLRRHIGYVIQSNGLMPHMTIKDNITIVPRLLKWSEDKIEQKVQELIQLAELPTEFLNRYPAELSGGQQQRVGVLRALAADQDLILMDEPFGALDPITRETLQDFVKKLQTQLDKTIIFVTHDMDEALKLATQMVIMNEGKVIQDDTPVNILHQPANEFVKNLLGEDRLEEAQHYTVQVGEIMLTDPVKINIGASLTQALSVMKNRHVDTLLVTDDSNHLKGFISVSKLDKRYHHVDSVSDILETKLATLHPDSYLRDYAGKILQGNMTYVPVVDHQDKLVGIVTRSALVNLVYSTIWGSTEGNIQGADKHE